MKRFIELALWLTLYFLLALAVWTMPVQAQERCKPHDELDTQLRSQYGETVQTRALDGSGFLFFTYANTETGSWTLVRARPDGHACMVAAGHGFWLLAEPPGEAL